MLYASDPEKAYHSNLAANLKAAQLVLLIVEHALVRGQGDDHACCFAAEDGGKLGDWVEALAGRNPFKLPPSVGNYRSANFALTGGSVCR